MAAKRERRGRRVGVVVEASGAIYALDIDGDTGETGLLEFLAANREGLDDDAVATISTLRIGEAYEGGGGAAVEWAITRVA